MKKERIWKNNVNNQDCSGVMGPAAGFQLPITNAIESTTLALPSFDALSKTLANEYSYHLYLLSI